MAQNGTIIKDFYQKRACCNNNTPIRFSLPSIGKNDKDQNVIVPTVLETKIFTDDEFKDPNVCKFDDADFKKTDQKNENQGCNFFYGKFCNSIYDSRSVGTSDQLIKYYGPYENNDEKSLENKLPLNEFRDCNCLNSKYIRDPYYEKELGKENTSLNIDSLAQNADKRCFNNVVKGIQKAYTRKNFVADSFCASMADFSNAQILGTVKNEQTCPNLPSAPNKQPIVSPGPAPPPPVPPPPSPVVLDINCSAKGILSLASGDAIASINNSLSKNYIFYGSGINNNDPKGIPVKEIKSLPDGRKLFLIEDGEYVKMVLSTGEIRYYKGKLSDFVNEKINTYPCGTNDAYNIKSVDGSSTSPSRQFIPTETVIPTSLSEMKFDKNMLMIGGGIVIIIFLFIIFLTLGRKKEDD